MSESISVSCNKGLVLLRHGTVERARHQQPMAVSLIIAIPVTCNATSSDHPKVVRVIGP
jgi:hypothetical protein